MSIIKGSFLVMKTQQFLFSLDYTPMKAYLGIWYSILLGETLGVLYETHVFFPPYSVAHWSFYPLARLTSTAPSLSRAVWSGARCTSLRSSGGRTLSAWTRRTTSSSSNVICIACKTMFYFEYPTVPNTRHSFVSIWAKLCHNYRLANIKPQPHNVLHMSGVCSWTVAYFNKTWQEYCFSAKPYL